MTEGTGSQPADDQATPEPEFPTINTVVDFYSRPDPALQDLAAVANLGAGVAVTLYLPWGIVSGHLEANHEFFAAAAAAMRSGAQRLGDQNSIDMANAIAGRSFDPWAVQVPENERMTTNFQQGYDLTSFVSLTHVQAFLSGDCAKPLEHEHLRVRLSSITAWAHGMFRAAQSE